MPDRSRRVGSWLPDTENGHALESLASDSRAARLVERFAAAWEQGERPSVERFLAGAAPDEDDTELVVRLIYEEMCLRREAGDEVTADELRQRFPRWQAELQVLLDCERLLAPAAPVAFPEAGEEIGPFRLLSELGRGAMGRVYLASQPALSDRPVVVKLTSQAGQEHLSLARLQHSSIVPLYLVQNVPERHLRLLCMPYLGGVTLAQLCQSLAAATARPLRGRDVAAALQAASPAERGSVSHRGPALQFLERASYVQAVCWIGACLADALHYAHQRGLAHFDVKPSNVLLAGDGQPMLLDFHLARGPLLPGAPERWLGGTPGYMSPEQEAALAALGRGEIVPAPVDHRSDIYALGVVLDEMLRIAPDQRASRLSAIVAKCRAASPARRYADAAALAQDLRQGIADDAADRPAGKATSGEGGWRSRAWTMSLAAVAVGALLSAGSLAWRLRSAERTATALRIAAHEKEQRERSHRVADSLRAVAARLRWLDSREPLDAAAAQSLAGGCRTVWERRQQFLAAGVSDEERVPVRNALAEVAALRAEAELALAAHRPGADRRVEVLAELAAAENELGAQPVLAYLRQRLQPRGETGSLPELPPLQAAWEHGLVGRMLLREGRTADAQAVVRCGAARAPHDVWLQFTLGLCAERLGQSEEALAAYSACVALAPERAECRRRRAAAFQALGRRELAALDEERSRQLADAVSPNSRE